MSNQLNVDIEKHFLSKEITKYCQKLDQKGFGANHDGNITVKCFDQLLATPTAVSKGNIIPEMVITLDMQGSKIAGVGKPFSEIKLHLAAYLERKDIKAVVHAHPPFATARGLLNLPIIPNIPEAVVSLGDIVPVIKPSESAVTEFLQQADVFMIAGNGVLAVGDSIEQAYLRLELVEHLAKIDCYAKMMGGNCLEIKNDEMATLLQKRVAAGLGPKKRKPKANDSEIESIKKIIADELKILLR